MTMQDPKRPPLPPFTYDDAVKKVRMAEDAWNTRDPDKVAAAYTPDTRWRNRDTFLHGRDEVRAFLVRKWAKENGYRLIKEIWAHSETRIAVRFCYEWHDETGQWFRAHGNENWAFSATGHMAVRHASINDVPIDDVCRKFLWPQGPRPETHPGLTDLGL
ncbi:MAG: nuclear transport factor 2 family protein [Pseudomonadota bacterium]